MKEKLKTISLLLLILVALIGIRTNNYNFIMQAKAEEAAEIVDDDQINESDNIQTETITEETIEETTQESDTQLTENNDSSEKNTSSNVKITCYLKKNTVAPNKTKKFNYKVI